MADDYKSPGWYPAPDGAGEQWWNGASWSDSKRGAAAPPTPPVVYSAENPAPQRPDPYAAASVPVATARSVQLSQNRYATIGLVLAIISLVANLFWVLAPLSIVLSALGVRTGRALKARGVAGDLLTLAWVGVGIGILSTVIAVVQVVLAVIAGFEYSIDPS